MSPRILGPGGEQLAPTQPQKLLITMPVLGDPLGTATIKPLADMTGKESFLITMILITSIIVPGPQQGGPAVQWRQFIAENGLERHFDLQPHPNSAPGKA